MPPKQSKRKAVQKQLGQAIHACNRLFRRRLPTHTANKDEHGPSEASADPNPIALLGSQTAGPSVQASHIPISEPSAVDHTTHKGATDEATAWTKNQVNAAPDNPQGTGAPHPLTAHPDHMVLVSAMDNQPVVPATSISSLNDAHRLGNSKGNVKLEKSAVILLKASLITLRRTLNVVPVFGPAASTLIGCIDNIPTVVQNRKEYSELASDIALSVTNLEAHLGKLSPTQMKGAVSNVVGELTKQATHIQTLQGRTATKTYMNAEQDIEDLLRCYRRVDALFRQLQSDAVLSIWRTTNESLTMASESLANTRLRELLPVQAARYDSSAASQVRRTGCTPNTRQLVLQELQEWASDPSSTKVYWMNGMAGTGKTTIAYSLCSQLEATQQLAANFFCSRSLPECRDAVRIVPTIAYQLARFCLPFQDVLCQTLRGDPDTGSRGVMTQFRKLLSDPLQKIKDKMPVGLFVVVIDALDECSDRSDAMLVLNALLRFAGDLPTKPPVACRPDSALLSMMTQSGNPDRALHLHDIDSSLVQSDIETYLKVELDSIYATNEQIKRLAEQSGRLFIYAATCVRYIGTRNAAIDHHKRLDIMLNLASNTNSTNKPHEALDTLYTSVLDAAFGDDLEEWDIKNIILVLHTVVCVKEPLTMTALVYLLQLESTDQVRRAISPLFSVFHLDEQTGTISALHASFSDYMLNAGRSGRFFCNEAKQSQFLARRCFETMSKLLRFNICNFESSFSFDKDVLDLSDRVLEAVPVHLHYACRYWSEHFIRAEDQHKLLDLLRIFLQRHILFWVEVMNIKRSTSAGVVMLSDLYRQMKTLPASNDVHNLCQDAQRFIAVVGANTVCQSTPHIYVSILALWDKKAPIWKQYGIHMQGMVQAEGPAIDNKGSEALIMWRPMQPTYAIAVSRDGRQGHMKHVSCVAFSPDDCHVASGSHDCTIRIWSTQTGREVSDPLHAHTRTVRSISYSSDGSRLASGSEDRTILIWDVPNRRTAIEPITGHTDSVNSVAYSPDDRYIVSGSSDNTIRVCNALTGCLVLGPLIGHTNRVYSVAYSPNGDLIASGSHDCTLRVWNAHTGDLVTAPFQGHTHAVRSISYSPDGHRIVSGSYDSTVRVWDAKSGETVAGPFIGHTGWVNSVAYMPDSDRVVTGSGDRTIRIWDVENMHSSSAFSEGHDGPVYSAIFSHDSVISGSEDHSVCIWDAHTGKKMSGPLTGHTGPVLSVGYSLVNNTLISGSADSTVRFWDMQTDHAISKPCKEHTSKINSLASSPDGSRAVSGSGDCTLRIWDLDSGDVVAGPLKGHRGPILSVAYSHDGSRIVSCSEDDTIRVWDGQTGETVAGPFEGCLTAAYSSDSKHIVSSTDTYAVFICDAQTGLVAVGPFQGHTEKVLSVIFSPDNQHIVSSSKDRTIRIWDANTGDSVTEPLCAHTDWVNSVSFSVDGRLLASCSDDGAIRIWDWQTLISPASNDIHCWSVNEEGWAINSDSLLLFWVPPDLRVGLKWPQNNAVIHRRGDFELKFANAYIGTEWTRCYLAK